MTLFFYLAVAALFLLLAGFRLFAEGMFVDGVTYAAISRNLANGSGSFWEPHLSATLHQQFHGHPPLAFGLEGLAFKISGDSIPAERVYSLLTFLVTGYLIVLIWKELTGERKSGWIPLLFWVLFPLVSWAYPSNLLDNTLAIFTTLSILFILKYHSRSSFIFLVLGGLSLFAGLLTKGPFALFPWVLPLLLAFSRPKFQFKNVAVSTLILILSTLVPLLILVTLSAVARDSLQAYWMNQVVGSLTGVQTVTSRFYILYRLLMELILPLVTAGLIAWIFRNQTDPGKIREYRQPVIVLMVLGLCGVVPVMISLKQSSFYILSALPVFALMVALPVWSVVRQPLSSLNASRPGYRIFRFASVVFLIASLALSPVFAILNRRDHKKLEMIQNFGAIIPGGTTIRIQPALYADWSLHAYFARYHGISLDPSENPSAAFFLAVDDDPPADTLATHLTCISKLNGYMLFKK